MTHMPGVPIAFDPPSEWHQTVLATCRRKSCHNGDVWWRAHDSSDGAFQDTEFECRTCSMRWWVDGVDS